jgi:hypothetical protein
MKRFDAIALFFVEKNYNEKKDNYICGFNLLNGCILWKPQF